MNTFIENFSIILKWRFFKVSFFHQELKFKFFCKMAYCIGDLKGENAGYFEKNLKF
jgi:hypothetical protein